MLNVRDAIALSILPSGFRHSVVASIQRPRAPGRPTPAGRLEAWLPRSGVGLNDLRDALTGARRRADEALAWTRAAAGVEVLALGHPGYPLWLATIHDPPPALWVRGIGDLLDTLAVAIVGSRAASSYAIETAERLAETLAERSVTVVSGLARGVDAAAHRGALVPRQGRTIAVLGSGVDVIYPPEHDELAAAVAARSALVTEHLPGTRPYPGHFPQRNRIISGLSRAVVVVEASERSGALITARYALDQGRDVMAVPGNVLSGRNRGGHGLLKDGAKIVEDADDILEELGVTGRPLAGPVLAAQGNSDPVLSVMIEGDTHDLDFLLHHTGLDRAVLLSRLFELELAGRVARADGGRFRTVGRKW